MFTQAWDGLRRMWTLQRRLEKHYLQLLLNIFQRIGVFGWRQRPETVKVLGGSRNALSRSEQVWLSKLVIPALLGLGLVLSFPFSGPLSPSSFELQCYMLFFPFNSAYSSSVIWFHWRKWQAFIKCPSYVPVTMQVPQVKLQPKAWDHKDRESPRGVSEESASEAVLRRMSGRKQEQAARGHSSWMPEIVKESKRPGSFLGTWEPQEVGYFCRDVRGGEEWRPQMAGQGIWTLSYGSTVCQQGLG